MWKPLTLLVASLMAMAAETPPNVVVIMADDQGYGDFSLHGNPQLKTPNLDRLGQESVRLTDFHVMPMCTPTRGALLTGLDPLRNGAYSTCQGRSTLRPGLPTMPGLFQQAGYRTGVFGKWHLGHNYPHRPQDRGFAESFIIHGFGPTDTSSRWNNDYQDPWFVHNGVEVATVGYHTHVTFDAAKSWITTSDRTKPFFVYLPVHAPHFPFWPPEGRFREEYAQSGAPAFFAMIADLDDQVGKFRAFLDTHGLSSNTILVYTSDNGGAGGTHVFNAGMTGSKVHRLDGGHRAPGFVHWPQGGLAHGTTVTGTTQVQDVLPTLLDLAGINTTATFDGISLAAPLRGQAPVPERSLVVQIQQFTIKPREQSAVLRGPWRLVDGTALYNIVDDPAQKTDISAQHPAIRDRLLADYDAWFAQVQPLSVDVIPTLVGHPAAPIVKLDSSQWLDTRADGMPTVRKAEPKLGPVNRPPEGGWWPLQVEKAGTYRVTLSRWPEEAHLAMTAGTPAFSSRLGGETLPPGTALPIAQVSLSREGHPDVVVPVPAEAKAVTIDLTLPAGPTRLRGTCRDAAGVALCGTFFARIEAP